MNYISKVSATRAVETVHKCCCTCLYHWEIVHYLALIGFSESPFNYILFNIQSAWQMTPKVDWTCNWIQCGMIYGYLNQQYNEQHVQLYRYNTLYIISIQHGVEKSTRMTNKNQM